MANWVKLTWAVDGSPLYVNLDFAETISVVGGTSEIESKSGTWSVKETPGEIFALAQATPHDSSEVLAFRPGDSTMQSPLHGKLSRPVCHPQGYWITTSTGSWPQPVVCSVCRGSGA